MSLTRMKTADRRRKTQMTRKLKSLAVTLVLIGTAMMAWPPPSEAATEPETEETAAELTIMGHVFRVPKAYLTQDDDRAGRVIDYWGGAFFMWGVLPDLRAPVGREVEYYSGGKPLHETVDFQVWARPGHAGPDKYYFKEEALRNCTGPIRGGYLICPHKRSYLPDQEVLVRVDETQRLAFICDKKGPYPNPLCKIVLPLLSDVTLEIGFSREKFDFADAIIARVYELVCLFYRPDAGRKSAVNHCP